MPAIPALSELLAAAAAAAVGAALGLWLAPLTALFQPYSDDPEDDETPPGTVAPPACPHCGETVPWSRWSPVPWRLLRTRRCASCGRGVAGSAAVPVLLAAVGAGLALRFGPSLELLAFGYFAGIGIVLAVVDARTHRLPDPLVKPSYLIGGALLAVAALQAGPGPLLGAALGLAGLGGLYGLMVLISPTGMGRGDFKLAGLLGLYLGWAGLAPLLVAVWTWALLAAVVGAVWAALRWARADKVPAQEAWRTARKTPIPLGPFMIACSLGAILAGDLPAQLMDALLR